MTLYLRHILFSSFFFFNDTATTEIYTLSLHDALPISGARRRRRPRRRGRAAASAPPDRSCGTAGCGRRGIPGDRKSTRLNSSHMSISHAVFCLKKKKKKKKISYKHVLQIYMHMHDCLS